ncbi:MAG: AAA family ATPase [Chloroflexi bacterium]|nr:AAA family ATPase [Chloroflexota bacterium]
MYIEKIHLISFKGFRDFTLKCSPFTTLVGLNSSGKTSILQALQLAFDICVLAFGGHARHDILRPDFSGPQWESDPSYGVNRLSFGDPDALWLNKITSVPCKLAVGLSGGVELHLEIPGRNRYVLDVIADGQSVKNVINEPTNQKIVEDMFQLRPTYVPPVGGLSPSEDFQPFPSLTQKLDRGLIGECWRGNLYWLCNDGNNEDFDTVRQIVGRYLPDANILQPRLGHDGRPQILIEFEQDGVTFDISTSGGGFRTVLSLATVLHFSKSKCLLLDEPDAHLHGSLQRSIAQMLLDHVADTGVQIFVASHAPGFIAELPIESLTWVDRASNQGRSCDTVGRFLADLGAISKADAVRAWGVDKILFIEGSLDRNVMDQFVTLCSKTNPHIKNPFADSCTIVAKLPNGKGDRIHLLAFQQLLRETFKVDVKIGCIVDKDYDFSSDNSSDDVTVSGPLLVTLGRKEIENYLLDANIVAKATTTLAEQRAKHLALDSLPPTHEAIEKKIVEIMDDKEIRDVVRCQLLPRYRQSLDRGLDDSTRERRGEEWFQEKWGDPDWRIRNCPGKDVLSKLRAWCRNEYSLSLTSRLLIEALEQCPEDVQDIASKIQSHFYG